MNRANGNRSSLILAGGGLKVAFQAGVLQVWLDEAGLEFDHVDGASGGVFNLAMLCQGMSGTQIADNWRTLPAHRLIEPNWKGLRRPLTLESLAALGRLRSEVFTGWGLDFDAIRATNLDATFNTYNFSRHELEVITPDRLTEDLLVSCVSLPVWFPPVRIDGDTYIDAVYISDANVEEALRRGADEIWAIWTVSELSEWRGGFLGHYFGVIETAANGHFRRILRRIEDSNDATAGGGQGEFGRHVDLKLLAGEVPLHYLLNLNPDRFTQAVERGVAAGRRWCDGQGIPYEPTAPRSAQEGPRLTFREELRGSLEGSPLGLRLDVEIPDFEAFIADLAHPARVTGEVESTALGGVRAIEDGTVEILADDGDYRSKRVSYRLALRDASGRRLTLEGDRRMERGALREAAVLPLRLLADDGREAATGVARLDAVALLRELRSLRSDRGGRGAIGRFALFWIGSLWDVHARRLLPVSPV